MTWIQWLVASVAATVVVSVLATAFDLGPVVAGAATGFLIAVLAAGLITRAGREAREREFSRLDE